MHGLLGRKQSPEHIQKRVDACRKAGVYSNLTQATIKLNKSRTGIPLSEDTKKKISESMKGKQNSLGRKHPLEFRQYLSALWTNNPKHNHWIDGKSDERTTQRRVDMGRLQYRLWREEVFRRDNWMCIHCGIRGGKLQADHIQLYSTYPNLRYEVSNGRTLCVSCHRLRGKWDHAFSGKT